MNVFFGLTLAVISTYLGYCFSKKHIEKREFYSDFLDFNVKFRSAVAFSQDTILSLLKNCKSNSCFYNKLKNYFIDKKQQLFCKNDILTESEIDFFNSYISTIGNTDKQTQIDFLDNAQKILESEFDSAKMEEKKYKSLYIKIGFLIGLILFVVVL